MGKFMEVNGKKLVALRSAVEEMGGKVAWDNQSKQATVDLNGKVTVVTMNDADMSFDGNHLTLSAAPRVHEGTLYVPEDFFPAVLKLQMPF